MRRLTIGVSASLFFHAAVALLLTRPRVAVYSYPESSAVPAAPANFAIKVALRAAPRLRTLHAPATAAHLTEIAASPETQRSFESPTPPHLQRPMQQSQASIARPTPSTSAIVAKEASRTTNAGAVNAFTSTTPRTASHISATPIGPTESVPPVQEPMKPHTPVPTFTPLPSGTPTALIVATPSPAPVLTPSSNPPTSPTLSPTPAALTLEAQATNQVAPSIPDSLKNDSFKASVRVKVKIREDGNFTPTLATTSGNAQIDRYVLEALRQWKWKPAINDGVTVSSTKLFRFDFEVN